MSMQRTRRPPLGASTAGIVATLLLLGGAGLVGLHFYSTYQVLDRAKKLETSLETVHRYRGAHRVTKQRIVDTVLKALREAGGTLAPGDVQLKLEPLTLANGNTLPSMMRYKLTMQCHLKGVQGVRNNRIDRARRAYEGALRRGATAAPPPTPSSVAPPKPGGNIGCSAEELEALDYTFVQVTARTKVKHGWVTKQISLKRSFYLPQPASAPGGAGETDRGTDDDDE